MNEDTRHEIERLFDQAIELPINARSAFLDQSCGDDEFVRKEVVSLLHAHDNAQRFLHGSALEQQPNRTLFADPWLGQTIGRYRVLERIATGGMGSVYLAERSDHAFDKRVAIKVIRRGMDSEDILARFRHERQLLANLEHPNIAHIIDGGSTEDHQPYLVMEFVDGKRLDEYADQHRLTVDQRLDLFLTVCAAVQAAHRNLIVHRDLKPSNVLVTEDGTVKLLDFGIAKVLSSETLQRTAEVTATLERRLTPAYASPEQIRGQAITTSADIYSLGVILFELLTGQRPHHVEHKSIEEAGRAICEDPPTRPSTAVRQTLHSEPGLDGDSSVSSATTPESIAQLRSTDPARLQRMLHGDLENIILMALRKEPERRYSTVEQFADDLRRYRHKLPVVARADTLRYRATRFIQRNRVGVAASILLLVTLCTASIISTLLYVETARERDRAQLAEQRAERRFTEVHTLANTMLFDVHDHIRKLPGSTGPSRVIVTTAHEYLEGLRADALDNSDLLIDIAAAYRRLGDIQGGLMGNPGLGEITGALASYQTGLDIIKTLLNDDDTCERCRIIGANLLMGIGFCHDEKNQLDVAEAAFREGKAMRQSVRHPDHVHTLPLLHTFHAEIAKLRIRQGSFAEAEHKIRHSIELTQQHWRDHSNHPRAAFELATAKMMLGELLLNLGRPEEAEVYLLAAVAHAHTATELTPTDRDNRRLLLNVEWLHARLITLHRDLTAGVDYSEQLLEKQHALMAEDPLDRSLLRDIATSHRYLGEFYVKLDNAEAGLSHYQRAVEMRQRLIQLDATSIGRQRDLAAAIDMKATALWRLGRFEEAMVRHTDAAQVFTQLAASFPDDIDLARSVAVSAFNLGELNSALSTREDHPPSMQATYRRAAAEQYQRALEIMTAIRDSGRLSGNDATVIPMLKERISASWQSDEDET